MLISQLTPAPKPLEVTFENGEVLPITYDRSRLTVPLAKSIQKDAATNDPIVLLKVTCTVIKTWELADERGNIPVGPEHEAEVGDRVNIDVLGTILAAIQADISVDPTSAKS